MNRLPRAGLAIILLAALPMTAFACLWDYDTLRQERARFPNALELITGKFLRHSKEFYEWRIQDRSRRLQAEPNNFALYDDLAVAYQKTGQHEKAVETILAKEKTKPGLYETYANLGTFYMLAGEFEKGLPYIDKALAINPDAHFGRERYQKWLVEYALENRKEGELKFPMRSTSIFGGGFRNFLARRLGQESLGDEDRQKAIKGILGMMRFANHENPLLLEALGDVLHDVRLSGAKRLAASAYLKASHVVTDESSKRAYRSLAENALQMQTPDSSTVRSMTLAELEAEFASERADADRWYNELKNKEIKWIRDGMDVDVEFDRLYVEEPELPDYSGIGFFASWGNRIALAVGLVLALLAGGWVLSKYHRRSDASVVDGGHTGSA